jgi:hypothetical protein
MRLDGIHGIATIKVQMQTSFLGMMMAMMTPDRGGVLLA